MMTAPCSLNTEPYLTEWHADLESGMEIWIQTNEDESNPKWVRLGNLLEIIWIEQERYALFGSDDSYDMDNLADDLYGYVDLSKKKI